MDQCDVFGRKFLSYNQNNQWNLYSYFHQGNFIANIYDFNPMNAIITLHIINQNRNFVHEFEQDEYQMKIISYNL